MPSIVFDDFRGGLDLRRNPALSAANILLVLNNAYVTTGRAIRKRPCATKIAELESGTVGLKAGLGKLNTFYGSGSITHANTLFAARKVAHPTTPALAVNAVHYCEPFAGYLYASVGYTDGSIKHHYLDTNPTSAVTDVNCPHTKEVAKVGSRIFAAKAGGLARFSALGAPRDWTTVSDAGFIDPGSSAGGSSEVTALAAWDKNLTCFFSDSVQVWDIFPDPADHSLRAQSAIGCDHYLSPGPIAGDLMFLAQQGFRTIGIVSNTDNLQENDAGSPIDELRDEIELTDSPRSVFYPKLGQYWQINGGKVYVYSFSRSVKLSAWSTFEFPFNVDDATVLAGQLYLRSGDNVYRVDDHAYTDNGVAPLVEVEMYYVDAKSPGMLKQFTGFDALCRGSAEIAFGYTTENQTLETDFYTFSGDTRPGGMNPMEICAQSIAPRLRHQADELFELSSIQCYYEELGPL